MSSEKSKKEKTRLHSRNKNRERYDLQALIKKDSGEFIGQCGLLAQDISGRNELEVDYHLIPRYWGKGYATKAAKEFKSIGFENNLAESIISIIDCENTPSQKVAERSGMTRGIKTEFMEMDDFIYRITKDNFYNL